LAPPVNWSSAVLKANEPVVVSTNNWFEMPLLKPKRYVPALACGAAQTQHATAKQPARARFNVLMIEFREQVVRVWVYPVADLNFHYARNPKSVNILNPFFPE
jgi:hypothetical protein